MGFRMIETVRELQKKVHDLANGRLGPRLELANRVRRRFLRKWEPRKLTSKPMSALP